MRKIGAAVMMVLAMGLTFAVPVWADGVGDSEICNDPMVDETLKEAAGCSTTKQVDTVINNVLKTVLAFVGLVAVCVMVYGGATYITSTGDSSKTQRAKNIILYGLVGLIVSLLAYAIVTFVSQSVG